MKTKTKASAPIPIAVPLEFYLPEAKTVCIAGTFNGWSPTAAPLRHDGDGTWSTTLRLRPGRHEYRLVIDGLWHDAPGVTETIDNAYGSTNAVLTVPAHRLAPAL